MNYIVDNLCIIKKNNDESPDCYHIFFPKSFTSLCNEVLIIEVDLNTKSNFDTSKKICIKCLKSYQYGPNKLHSQSQQKN